MLALLQQPAVTARAAPEEWEALRANEFRGSLPAIKIDDEYGEYSTKAAGVILKMLVPLAAREGGSCDIKVTIENQSNHPIETDQWNDLDELRVSVFGRDLTLILGVVGNLLTNLITGG